MAGREEETFFVDTPPNQDGPLNDIWLWVSVDERGEGIVAALTPIGNMPLFYSMPSLHGPLERVATKVSVESNRMMRLVRFSRAEIVKTIHAPGAPRSDH